ncbi:unnamed protein product [Linum tenue]|uniref:Uncharacterized protein n=1 Tax=Linum tenue TaxID=586396 RepID=A0AAV0K1R0_9ROSI|nr:unnamed protein product [Linum tenue]
MGLNLIWLLIIQLCISASADGLYDFTAESLDAFLEASAFQTVFQYRRHTGALYQALLPSNLSGIRVSVVRLRSRRLWNLGANFSNFRIPPRTMPMPHVKRLAIVYQDLGNRSSEYYSVEGYSFLAPVVGFQVFDVSNISARNMIRKISLDTGEKSVAVNFPGGRIKERSGAQCIVFGSDGSFDLREMEELDACYVKDQGHFSVVVPEEGFHRKEKKLWFLWMVVGIVVGMAGLVLVAYFGFLLSKKLLKTKKIQVMERQADEDLVLQTVWIRSSKMPSAAVTRTQPTIETGYFP